MTAATPQAAGGPPHVRATAPGARATAVSTRSSAPGARRARGAAPHATAPAPRSEADIAPPTRAVRPGQRRRPISLITLRILAVNILALMIVLGSLLFLGFYQEELIQNELDSLRTEAQVAAAMLGEAAITIGMGGTGLELSPVMAEPLILRLVETNETRAVLVDAERRLLVDSRLRRSAQAPIQIIPLGPPGAVPPRRDQAPLLRVLDRLLPRRQELAAYPLAQGAAAATFPDLELALAGAVQARAWQGSRGIVITAVAPIQRYHEVMGAVLLAREGDKIDAALGAVRRNILEVAAVALLVTVLMSIYLARTIDRPIRRLAAAAEDVRRARNRRTEIPDFTSRGDEIGDLSGALRDMTEALWSRLDAIERFAADVSHELKNPLTSLRSAIETMALVKDPERQQKLMRIISEDVQRLDRLITDISNFSRLDSELSRAEARRVHLGQLLKTLAEIHQAMIDTGGIEAIPIRLVGADDPDLHAVGVESRLVQVFQNLITNAVSFSPPGSFLTVGVWRDGPEIVAHVTDSGPGIPDGKLEAIFERFYTERPQGEKFGTHSGLGLSISRRIVESVGGRIWAENVYDGEGKVTGARFWVRLPRG